ncbi:hypothetical protein [Ruegeria sp. HKCCA4633]|uniref:hypothetical protein n=1 Tax=Ruegeria sp. HKCCA4633 TaxID=2682983 RepID=UPI00148804CD|nr:hypothetical protein [Ruegeria sp. HKCCA4633]
MAKLPETREEVIFYMNRRYAVVPVGGKVFIVEIAEDPVLRRKRVNFFSERALRLKLSNRVIEVYRNGRTEPDYVSWVDVWLNSGNRRQYRGVVFDPQHGHNSFLNLWFGFSVEPKSEDASRFLSFVREVICSSDEQAYQYLMSYFAHMVQRPRELPGTAIVLLGSQGVGKGFFMQQMGALVTNHYVQITQAKHLPEADTSV